MMDCIPVDGIGIKNHKIRQQKLYPQLVDQVLELRIMEIYNVIDWS